MMHIILYPVEARHTAPLVRGIAKAMAKCHAICDLFSDIVLNDGEVRNHAVVAFRAFCESQETEYLTDDLEALQDLYVDAYETMYRQRYPEVIADLTREVAR